MKKLALAVFGLSLLSACATVPSLPPAPPVTAPGADFLARNAAAKRLPLSQPKLSLVTRGKLDGISQAMLEECLQALGHDIEIKINRRHEGVGQLRVLEDA